MADSNIVLAFTEKDSELHYTGVYQLNDGTNFYYCFNDWKTHGPQRLYVKWQGEEINAQLPVYHQLTKTLRVEAQGDALYFAVNTKVYKALFSPDSGITITFYRKWNEVHNYHFGTSTAQWHGQASEDGMGKIQRLCDMNHTVVGIPKEVKERDPRWTNMQWNNALGLHRGKTIYLKIGEAGSQPAVHVLNEKEVVLELPPGPPKSYLECCLQDSSRFIYLAMDNNLFTLDTEDLKFLPTLQCGSDLKVDKIVGVHNGLISIVSSRTLFVAELPPGYFGPAPVASTVDAPASPPADASPGPSTSGASRKRTRKADMTAETGKEDVANAAERRYPTRRSNTGPSD